MPTNKAAMIGFLMKDRIDFLEKCIVLLYKQQNPDEQAMRDTNEDNGVGFNKPDANRLTRYAQKLIAKKDSNYHLDEAEFNDASERMQKYCKQLAKLVPDEEVV